MNNKILASIVISIAVVVAAIAGIVITNNRAATARSLAQKAESEEVAATQAARQAKAEQAKAEAEAARAKDEAEKAREMRKAEDVRRGNLKLENETALAEKARAAKDAKAAEENAKAAEAKHAAEKAKLDVARVESEKARAVADAAAMKAAAEAQAAADKLAAEKLKSDAVIAEAKVLELRQIDFETLERELAEYKLELDERERALHPDKTAAEHLTWVGEREADVIGADTNAVKRKRVRVLAENDPSLPVESRKLARAERLGNANLVGTIGVTSNEVITILSRLYEDAIKADRVVDANYYLQNIRVFYPGWVYRPAEEKESQDVNKKKEEN